MSQNQVSGGLTTARIDEALKNATETKMFWLGEDTLGRVPEMFKALFPAQKACLVMDRNTLAAAGREVYAAMNAAGVDVVRPHVFEQSPHCDEAAVTSVQNYLREQGAVAVSVGSGRLNDICKVASFRVNQSYLCVATAASVDGYASCGAPMTVNGFKKTTPCPAPKGILADIGVLQRAPYPMTAAGYGDLMAKVTGGADWIIADIICGGVDTIQPVPWQMVQAPLEDWIKHPYELKSGDASAFSDLFEGLTVSGFAMQAAQSSRPASGCEHMFAHVWEMSGLQDADGVEPSHGFMVSVGTLMSLAAMDCIFSEPFSATDIEEAVRRYPTWEIREQMIRRLFGYEGLGDKVIEESHAKHLGEAALIERLHLIADHWSEMHERVEAQLMPFPRMREMLRCAGCPVSPSEIGLKTERCAASVIAAQMIRSRYTVLDLAYETGRLYDVVKKISEVWNEDYSL